MQDRAQATTTGGGRIDRARRSRASSSIRRSTRRCSRSPRRREVGSRWCCSVAAVAADAGAQTRTRTDAQVSSPDGPRRDRARAAAGRAADVRRRRADLREVRPRRDLPALPRPADQRRSASTTASPTSRPATSMIWNFLRGDAAVLGRADDATARCSASTSGRIATSGADPAARPSDGTRAIEAKLWATSTTTQRYYYYDHFFDNCTTRLRDMIDDATARQAARGHRRARIR